jgi:hypothetical protein
VESQVSSAAADETWGTQIGAKENGQRFGSLQISMKLIQSDPPHGISDNFLLEIWVIFRQYLRQSASRFLLLKNFQSNALAPMRKLWPPRNQTRKSLNELSADPQGLKPRLKLSDLRHD